MAVVCKLTRVLKTGITPGKDVEGTTRAMLRYLNDGRNWTAFYVSLPIVRRRWGPAKVEFAKRCAKKAGLPQYGVVGVKLETALREAGAFDGIADKLLREYAESVKPRLVEPYQGWASLHPSLWRIYSAGRNRGLGDRPGLASGTYSKGSTLPSGAPSDHSVWPAMAFDLDIGPDTGWDNLPARLFAFEAAADENVEYVILGDRIHVKGQGWKPYTAGGHLNHVHCSGLR